MNCLKNAAVTHAHVIIYQNQIFIFISEIRNIVDKAGHTFVGPTLGYAAQNPIYIYTALLRVLTDKIIDYRAFNLWFYIRQLHEHQMYFLFQSA